MLFKSCKKSLSSIILLTLLCCTSNKQNRTFAHRATSPKIIGYYFIQSAHAGKRPLDLPLNLMSHVIYSFVNISNEGECVMVDKRANYTDKDESIIKEFKEIKKQYPKIKTLFSIGGSVHSVNFSSASRTEVSRQKLVSSCINLMNKYNFDGIDLDWEVVGFKTSKNPNSNPSDPENFIKLLSQFRAAIPKGLLLSAAIGPDPYSLEFLDTKAMARTLDWIGIMNYDLCGTWSKVTCHHSEFGSITQGAIDKFLSSGADRDQIIIGVPFYGVHFKVASTENFGIAQPILVSDSLDDDLPYKKIMDEFLNKQDYLFSWDERAEQPILVNPINQTIISYDNEKSLSLKAKKIREEELGGILIWEVTGDDNKSTLLRTLNLEFNL